MATPLLESFDSELGRRQGSGKKNNLSVLLPFHGLNKHCGTRPSVFITEGPSAIQSINLAESRGPPSLPPGLLDRARPSAGNGWEGWGGVEGLALHYGAVCQTDSAGCPRRSKLGGSEKMRGGGASTPR